MLINRLSLGLSRIVAEISGISISQHFPENWIVFVL